MAIPILEPPGPYYAVRLVKGGIRCPAHIWYGPPLDPETGEPLDRSWRWNAVVNGQPQDPERFINIVGNFAHIWGDPISRAEYEFLLEDRKWCAEHAPDLPEANPTRTIDVTKMPPIKPLRRISP